MDKCLLVNADQRISSFGCVLCKANCNTLARVRNFLETNMPENWRPSHFPTGCNLGGQSSRERLENCEVKLDFWKAVSPLQKLYKSRFTSYSRISCFSQCQNSALNELKESGIGVKGRQSHVFLGGIRGKTNFDHFIRQFSKCSFYNLGVCVFYIEWDHATGCGLSMTP